MGDIQQNLRLWPSESGEAWRECVKSLGAEVLLVSQFTLYANVKKNKPNYAYASMIPLVLVVVVVVVVGWMEAAVNSLPFVRVKQ